MRRGDRGRRPAGAGRSRAGASSPATGCSRSAPAPATRRPSCRGSRRGSSPSSATRRWSNRRASASRRSASPTSSCARPTAADGLAAEGPFDRIVVWAAFESLPRAFVDQLSSGGIMIAPIGPEEGEQVAGQADQGRQPLRARGHRRRSAAADRQAVIAAAHLRRHRRIFCNKVRIEIRLQLNRAVTLTRFNHASCVSGMCGLVRCNSVFYVRMDASCRVVRGPGDLAGVAAGCSSQVARFNGASTTSSPPRPQPARRSSTAERQQPYPGDAAAAADRPQRRSDRAA